MSVLPLVARGTMPLNLPRKVASQLKEHSGSNSLPKGFISEDCLISILYAGPHLEVLSPVTGERLAAWTFSNYVNQARINIFSKDQNYSEFLKFVSFVCKIFHVVRSKMSNTFCQH